MSNSVHTHVLSGDGTYRIRTEHPSQESESASQAALAQAHWRQIYIDTQELNVQDWVEDYPDLVSVRQFTWGIAGWEAQVRETWDLRHSLFMLTLHGEVVDVSFEITADRAQALFNDAWRHAAEILSANLATYGRRTLMNGAPGRGFGEELRALDARWHYQAFTGLHVDVVNALMSHGATYEDLLRVATVSDQERRPLLDDLLSRPAVVIEDPEGGIIRMAAMHSPLAYLATQSDWIRLHAPCLIAL